MRLLLYGLIALLIVLSVWRGTMSDGPRPEWHLCKESLLEQVIFNNCTLIYEGDQQLA